YHGDGERCGGVNVGRITRATKTIKYPPSPNTLCHPERSEGPMHSGAAEQIHRSFASLRMTVGSSEPDRQTRTELRAVDPAGPVVPLLPRVFQFQSAWRYFLGIPPHARAR